MVVKVKDGVTEGITGEKSLENTVEGHKVGVSIEMGSLKTVSSNEVLSTEFLVVSKNVASWV